MTITTYQIQNVLRTYGRQLSRREALTRVARLTSGSGHEEAAEATVSAEAKRQQVIGRITKEIVSRMARQQQPMKGPGEDPGDEERQAFEALCGEYGRPLTVELQDGVEKFKAVDEQAGRLVELPEAESEKLRSRLYELTRAVVEQNMIKA